MTRPPTAALAALVAVVLLAVAPAAHADGTVSGPAEPVTGHGTVSLSGQVDATERGRLELRVTPPGGDASTVVADDAESTDQEPAVDQPAVDQPAVDQPAVDQPAVDEPAGGRELGFELSTAPCNLPSACPSGLDAPNGTWTLTLLAERRAGAPLERSTRFVVDVPARAPAGVQAQPGADRAVTVRWARGTEPDVAWTVTDGAGKTAAVSPGDDGACADGTCSTVFSYEPAETGSRSYAVTASRECGGEGCERRASAASSSEPVVLGSRPTAGPTPAPGSAPPGSPSPSPKPGEPAGSGTADTATAFGQGFSLAAPPGLPEILPPPSAAPPAVAAPPLVDGGFEGTLGYDDRIVKEPQEPVAAGRGSTLISTDDGSFASEDLTRSTAGALLLLLSAAHLRRWLSAGAKGVVDG